MKIRDVIAACCKKPEPKPHNPNPLNQPTIHIEEGGWILCSTAQPDFGQLVLAKVTLDTSPFFIIALAKRTKEVHSNGQERWSLVFMGASSKPGGITHWRPI